jgi:hypothetical protein
MRQLTVSPSCTASMATLASSSGSFMASRKAIAPRACFICPRHTNATSKRLVFTHMRARLSHTASLQYKVQITFT